MHPPVSPATPHARRLAKPGDLRHIEPLESRIAPAFTGVASGHSAVFTDEAGASTNLTIFAADGLLHHDQPFAANKAGAFNSNSDFDSAKPGDQTIDTASTFLVSIMAGDGNDQITLGDMAAASAIGAFLVDGGGGRDTLSVTTLDRITMTMLDDTSSTLADGTSTITAKAITNLQLHGSGLDVIGDTEATATWFPSAAGDAGGGSLNLFENGINRYVDFDGALATIVKFDGLSLKAPAGSHGITIGASGNGFGSISGTKNLGNYYAVSTRFAEIAAITLDLGTGDFDANVPDSVTVASLAGITGLQSLRIQTGAGDDFISLGSSVTTLALPVAGGVFSLDGGAGTDLLVINADIGLTLSNPEGIPTVAYADGRSLHYSGLDQFDVTVKTLAVTGGGGENVSWTPDRDVIHNSALWSNAGSLVVTNANLPARTIVYHLETLSAGAPPPLTIGNIYQLNLTTPVGADTFSMRSPRSVYAVELSGTTGGTGDWHAATIAAVPYISLNFGTGDAPATADKLSVSSLLDGLLMLSVSTGDGDDTLELGSGLAALALGSQLEDGFVFDAGAGNDTINAASAAVHLTNTTLAFGPSRPLRHDGVEHFIVDAGIEGDVHYSGDGYESLVWTPDAALTQQGTATFAGKDLAYKGTLAVSSTYSFTLITPAGADAFTLSNAAAAAPLAKIEGTVGGSIAHRGFVGRTPIVVLDFATGDGAGVITDTLTVTSLAGIEDFTLRTGAGDDTLTLSETAIRLRKSMWDAGAGNDTLNATADLSMELAGIGPGTPTLPQPKERGLLTYTDNDDHTSDFGHLLFTNSAVEIVNLAGGAGANRYLFTGWSGTVTARGGAGNDTFDFTGFATPEIGGFAGTGAFFGEGDDDTFIAQGDGATTFDGHRIGGAVGSITFDGGGGRDLLRAQGNVDLMLTDSLLQRTLPKSKPTLAQSVSTELASIEQASLIGGRSGNRLDARQFSGVADLSGEGGIDNLLASKGGGALYGFHAHGTADEMKTTLYTRDNFFASAGRAADVIHATKKAGNILSFRFSPTAVTYTIPNAAGGVVNVGGGLSIELAEGSLNAVEGSIFGDHLTGNKATNFLIGGKGNDVLRAVGFDYLYGGPGNDRLLGTTPFRFQDTNYPIPNSAGVLAPFGRVDSIAELIARAR